VPHQAGGLALRRLRRSLGTGRARRPVLVLALSTAATNQASECCEQKRIPPELRRHPSGTGFNATNQAAHTSKTRAERTGWHWWNERKAGRLVISPLFWNTARAHSINDQRESHGSAPASIRRQSECRLAFDQETNEAMVQQARIEQPNASQPTRT
jgi:hypothetical protein